ncbi:MAG: tryptophan synthase subunit alpha [Rubricoccaceae bacterium]|nr:tryptophan synthase subunit alpha [Rubricoccaceae bacterium]
MNRLQRTLSALRAREEKALGLFLTAGFPRPDATLPLLRAVDAAGADFVELGMPFSDPLAEGIPIQEASARALRHGTTLADSLRLAAAFRAESEMPLLLMGYANPVFRYGLDRFCRDAAAAGADGLILPDVPPEEADGLADAAAANGLALVFLVAPNTPDGRVRLVDRHATGFVYAVSVTGLTGSGLGDADATDAYLHRARALVRRNPLLVGFGIRTPEEAARLAGPTDGAIVGSALLQEVARLWDDEALSEAERLDRVDGWVRRMKAGLALPAVGT